MATTSPQRVLSDEIVAGIRAFFPRYPTRQAVTLPALHLVNEHMKHVPYAAVVEIAELLELAPAQIQDTLTFYGFFKQDKPHGEVRAWVCRSVACALRGADHLIEHMCERAGIHAGETTPDGKLTIEAAECLGACDFAPCILANNDLIKDVTIEQADKFVDKRGAT